MSWKLKKLVAVSAISMFMMGKKTEEELERILCIRCPVTLKDQNKALLNFEHEDNAMSQAFAHQLGFKIWKTNIGAQKIDGIILKP